MKHGKHILRISSTLGTAAKVMVCVASTVDHGWRAATSYVGGLAAVSVFFYRKGIRIFISLSLRRKQRRSFLGGNLEMSYVSAAAELCSLALVSF